MHRQVHPDVRARVKSVACESNMRVGTKVGYWADWYGLDVRAYERHLDCPQRKGTDSEHDLHPSLGCPGNDAAVWFGKANWPCDRLYSVLFVNLGPTTPSV